MSCWRGSTFEDTACKKEIDRFLQCAAKVVRYMAMLFAFLVVTTFYHAWIPGLLLETDNICLLQCRGVATIEAQ